MYYLDNLENCRFVRHPCSIVLSKMLKTIRRTEWSNLSDSIVVQAVLELLGEDSEYGPFRIELFQRTKAAQTVKLMKDGKLILEFEMKDREITIKYLREEQAALEELCEIADAHAVLQGSKERGK